MEQVVNFMNSIYPIQPETMQKFLSFCDVDTFKKKAVLCDFGEVCTHTYFVLDGICRTYVIDSNGKEVNKSLIGENKLVTSVKSVLFQLPSEYRIQTLTESKLAYIKYENFLYMMQHYPDFAIFNFKYTNYLLLQLENHVANLLVKDAMEKYAILKDMIPSIDNKISQRHIASYIGVTPIQLSRIRKKMLYAS